MPYKAYKPYGPYNKKLEEDLEIPSPLLFFRTRYTSARARTSSTVFT